MGHESTYIVHLKLHPRKWWQMFVTYWIIAGYKRNNKFSIWPSFTDAYKHWFTNHHLGIIAKRNPIKNWEIPVCLGWDIQCFFPVHFNRCHPACRVIVCIKMYNTQPRMKTRIRSVYNYGSCPFSQTIYTMFGHRCRCNHVPGVAHFCYTTIICKSSPSLSPCLTWLLLNWSM